MPKKRWQPLDRVDESALANLTARDDDVGLAALIAITRLPLRRKTWEYLHYRFLARRQDASPADRRELAAVGLWLPSLSDPDDQGGRPLRSDPEFEMPSGASHQWMYSDAPGSATIDEATRELSIEEIVPTLDERRDELKCFLDVLEDRSWENPEEPPPCLDAPTITAWFRYAYDEDDGRYDVELGNDVVATVSMSPAFTPDVRGLLVQYRRILYRIARRARRPIGGWIIDARDHEDVDSILSWHLAWTASRAGIADVVAELRPLIIVAADPEYPWPPHDHWHGETVVLLSFLADIADYVVQPAPEIFGGGRRPTRLGPDSRYRVYDDPLPDTVEYDARSTALRSASAGDEPEPSRIRFGPRRTPPKDTVEYHAPRTAERFDEDVRFTVYKPASIAPALWYSLLVFAHKTEPVELADGTELDPLHEVEERAARTLGDQVQTYAELGTDAMDALPRGDEIHFVPDVEGIEFNPPAASVRWEEPVHLCEFRMRSFGPATSGALRGEMLVYLGPLIIGSVSLSFPITGTADAPVSQVAAQGVRYENIFPSYSHHDAGIVEWVTSAVETLGKRYSQDVVALRSGERWESRLAQLIDEADIFQLFWSSNSMRSDPVRREWEHALSLGRPGFVRPVYWEVPRPSDESVGLPPPELNELHFSLLDIDADAPPFLPEIPASGSWVGAAIPGPSPTTRRLPPEPAEELPEQAGGRAPLLGILLAVLMLALAAWLLVMILS